MRCLNTLLHLGCSVQRLGREAAHCLVQRARPMQRLTKVCRNLSGLDFLAQDEPSFTYWL